MLPIILGDKVVAALLLGWDPEQGAELVAGDCQPRSSGTGGSKSTHNHQQQKQKQQAANQAAALAKGGGGGGGSLELGPADLRELRRLAQFLGFGLFSDPQQAMYLQQVGALTATGEAGTDPRMRGVRGWTNAYECIRLRGPSTRKLSSVFESSRRVLVCSFTEPLLRSHVMQLEERGEAAQFNCFEQHGIGILRARTRRHCASRHFGASMLTHIIAGSSVQLRDGSRTLLEA